jgi:hypothetical protein
MSSRRNKNRASAEALPDRATPEWSNPAPGTDEQAMHSLHVASQNVLRLATQTYNAAALGDAAAAQAARASLETQLGLTTRLIDEMLSDGSDRPTMH